LNLFRVAGQKDVVIDDPNLSLQERVPEIGRYEIAFAVVVVVALGMKHAKSVTDRDSRGHDQEPFRESRVVGRHDLVDRLPCDEHRHDYGLTAARGHFEADSRQRIVVQLVRWLEAAPVVGRAVPSGNLGKEDRRLCCLTLAKEDWVVTAWWASSPMGEQLPGVRRYAVPVACSPALDFTSDVVDEGVSLASLSGDVEIESLLFVLLSLA
jgi:hypothetical protein